jgi:hypothetical protein
MTRELLVQSVMVRMEALGLPADVWTVGHTLFGSTCGDRLQFSPGGWVASLGLVALDDLNERLRLRLADEQRADVDPELSRVTPQIDFALLYRPDYGR